MSNDKAGFDPTRLLSPTLVHALRDGDFAKLSHDVLYLRGEYPPADDSLQEAGRAVCMKLAVNLVNQAVVKDGIAAYEELCRE